MKNTLTYSQGAQSLLANMNDGTNRILINGVEIPSSDWTGTGTFTYSVEGATISIQRIADTSGNIMLQKVATDSYRLVRKEESSWQTTTGDTKDNVTTFTSSDVADGQVTNWTSVTPLASGEKHSSIFAKVSQMFKNIRYLFKMLGTTDISSIGDGTVTSAISALNVSLTNTIIKTLANVNASANVPLHRRGTLIEFRNNIIISAGTYDATVPIGDNYYYVPLLSISASDLEEVLPGVNENINVGVSAFTIRLGIAGSNSIHTIRIYRFSSTLYYVLSSGIRRSANSGSVTISSAITILSENAGAILAPLF